MTSPTSAHDGSTQVVKQGDRETIVRKTFMAPREAVFRALTSCEAINAWMKPEHMTLAGCSVDAKVAGSLRLTFLASKGRRLEVRDTYRRLDAPHLIQYDESYDFSPLELSVTVTLDVSGEATNLRETLLYRTMQERDEDFPGIAESVPGVYEKLDQYLQGK